MLRSVYSADIKAEKGSGSTVVVTFLPRYIRQIDILTDPYRQTIYCATLSGIFTLHEHEGDKDLLVFFLFYKTCQPWKSLCLSSHFGIH